ncbi:MAG: hypothetical protein ACR2FY_08415 [Pirellulaceae bacterium]
MAIDVTCASCKTRFQVSDKFAGKQGPCPKCKKIITVPSKKDEVVIHVPESGPKDSKGQLVLKPIARKETRLTPVNIGVIVGSIVLLLFLSLVLRIAYRESLRPPEVAGQGTKGGPPKTKEGAPTGTNDPSKEKAKPGDPVPAIGITVPPSLQLILALGAILLAPAIAFGGYTFLRNDELEPYRGQALWVRLLIISAAYPMLWGVYWALFGYFSGNFEGSPPLMALAMVVPLLILAGAFVAHVTLDFEYGTALLHCCMYLSATVLLRLIIGLPPHWTSWGTM